MYMWTTLCKPFTNIGGNMNCLITWWPFTNAYHAHTHIPRLFTLSLAKRWRTSQMMSTLLWSSGETASSTWITFISLLGPLKWQRFSRMLSMLWPWTCWMLMPVLRIFWKNSGSKLDVVTNSAGRVEPRSHGCMYQLMECRGCPECGVVPLVMPTNIACDT